MYRVRRVADDAAVLRVRHREPACTPVGVGSNLATSFHLTPFRRNAEGNAFTLQLSTASRQILYELVATDQDGREVVRVVVSDERSARSLCTEIVTLIKRFDPTSLVVIDLDFDAHRAKLIVAAE
jgi:hypothetical protein